MRITKWEFGGVGVHRDDVRIPVAGLGDAQIIGVVGDNGAGKTTALETLPGALYLETPSRGKLARLANRRDSFVRLGLDLDGEQIEAKLLINGTSRSPKTEAYLTSGGEAVSSGKVRDYESAVSDRLPPKVVYLASGFASQNGAGSFLNSPKADRKALFLRLLGANRLELVAKAAGERVKALDGEIARLRGVVEHSQGAREDLGLLAGRLDRARAAERTARDKLADLERQAEGLTAKREQWGADFRDAEIKVNSAKAALTTRQDDLSRANAEIARLRGEVDDISRKCLALEGEIEGKAEIEAEAGKRPELERQIEALENELADVRAQEATHRKQVEEWQTARTKAEAAYREAKAQWDLDKQQARNAALRASSDVERLTEIAGKLSGVPCDGAGDYAGCPLIAAAVEAKAKLPAAEAALTVARSEQDAADKEPEQLRDAVSRGRSLGPRPTRPDTPDPEDIGTLLDGARADLSAAVEAGARLERIGALAERIADLKQSGRVVVEKLEAARGGLPDLERSVAVAEEDLETASGDLGLLARDEPPLVDRAGLDAARAAVESVAREHTAVVERLRIAQETAKQVATTEQEIRNLTVDLDDWQEIKRAFGPNGIQALEIDAAGPEVSEICNDLLHSCYGPRFSASLETTALRADGKGQKEVFDLRVIDTERGTDGPADELSGGERVIVGEALSLAIAIFNTRRSSTPILDLFRDEVAGALSSTNAVRYVEMLRRAIDLGGFHRVWFVAHQPHLWPLADARLYFDGSGCRLVDEVPEVSDV